MSASLSCDLFPAEFPSADEVTTCMPAEVTGLQLELTSYQLDHLGHPVTAALAATQAQIDADGPVDHPLSHQLLLEISILERIDELRSTTEYLWGTPF